MPVPADSPRWKPGGEANVVEHQGRSCLLLDGGGATLQNFAMRDGATDVDISISATARSAL